MTNEEGQEYYNETMPLSKGVAPISDERLAEIEAATQPKASMVTLEPQEVRAVIARIRIAEAANRGLYGANVSQRNQYESERDALRATAFQAQEMAKEQMAQADALRAQVETLREALRSVLHLLKPSIGPDSDGEDALHGLPDCHLFQLCWGDEHNHDEPQITAGQLRRARAALAAAGGKKDE